MVEADGGAFWQRALQANRDLLFELMTVLIGGNSLSLCYKSGGGFSAEFLLFN